MNVRNSIVTLTLVSVFGLLQFVGCQSDVVNTPADTNLATQGQVGKARAGLGTRDDKGRKYTGETSLEFSCNTVSGMLLPSSGLNLLNLGSVIAYSSGLVSSPTEVSFSICDLDTIGTDLRPKSQVFGPTPDFAFLGTARVQLSLNDAGLPPDAPENSSYRIFRLNQLSNMWEFHQTGKITARKVKYDIIRNGAYALALTGVAITPETSWTVTGTISPITGGTLRLLNSRLDVPPLAVQTTTELSFTLSQAVPDSLPGALHRLYDFGPDGIVFRVPVVLHVAFGDAGIDSTAEIKMGPMDPYGYTFYHFDESSRSWVPQPTTVDRANREFVVQLNHFSRYAFGR